MSEKRIVKAFCGAEEQEHLAGLYEVIEKYDGFILLRATAQEAKKLAKKMPLEDITGLYNIRIGDKAIDTSLPRLTSDGRLHTHPAYRGAKILSPGRHHYLVQFHGPVKKTWLRRLKDLGAEVRVPFSAFTYVVRSDMKTMSKITGLPFVHWVGHFSHSDRIKTSVIGEAEGKELPRTRILQDIFTIEFFGVNEMKAAAKVAERIGGKILSLDDKSCVMTMQIPGSITQKRKKISELSAVHGVSAIRSRSIKRTSNDVASEIMGADTAEAVAMELSGAGEIIGICDTGLDSGNKNDIHPDFEGRVKSVKSYPISPWLNQYINNSGGDDGPKDLNSGHGTHVAGSALGSGKASTNLPNQVKPIRGLAYQAKLVFQAVEQEIKWKNFADEQKYGRYLLAGIPDDLTLLFSDAYKKGARIHSNSWGGGEPGEYDSQCSQLDAFVWDHKDFCVLVAAGNDGTDYDGDGQINSMSVTSPATAKNCITVGASESLRPQFNTASYGLWWPQDYPVSPYAEDPMADSSKQVVAFSSRGPTKDGRIKPDVISPGTFILSTRSRMIAPNNFAWGAFPASKLYFYMGGTSMATPLTAGAVALLREFVRKYVGINKPSAALLKAALITGATKLSGYSTTQEVCDIHQGFGLVSVSSVVAPPEPCQVIFCDVTSGLETGQELELPIDVYSDKVPLRITLAYSDYPGEKLVNNLNLIMTSPDGEVYIGNEVSGSEFQLDNQNNVEVINIQKPKQGKWNVQVVASDVPEGPQDFALVYKGDAY